MYVTAGKKTARKTLSDRLCFSLVFGWQGLFALLSVLKLGIA